MRGAAHMARAPNRCVMCPVPAALLCKRQASGRISTRKNFLSRPGEGQEGGREHSPSSLTPVTVREAERSYPRRGYRFLPKGKYRSFTDFFPKREILGPSPCFSFPDKADEQDTKDRFFPSGVLLRAAYFLRSGHNRSRGSPAWGEGAHRPIRPHPSGTLSAKKRREAVPPSCQPATEPAPAHPRQRPAASR